MSQFKKSRSGQVLSAKFAFTNSSLDASTSSSSFSLNSRHSNSRSATSPSRTSGDKRYVRDITSNFEFFVPKDSVEVLSELKPGVVFSIRYLDKINATVEINGRTYTGIGKSESIAKQTAAENALKDLFVDTIISTMTSNDIMGNTAEWKLLGSFAMFKLIEEWLLYYMSQTPTDKDGIKMSPLKYEENDHNQSIVTSTPKNKDKVDRPDRFTETDNKIILADTANAVVLLNSMLCNLKFRDLEVNKNKPPFVFSLLVDKIEYIGEPATSKKLAKQNVAKKVLMEKYEYKFINQ